MKEIVRGDFEIPSREALIKVAQLTDTISFSFFQNVYRPK